MKSARIAGLVMIILAVMQATSCSSDKSSGESSHKNPELWKILKESDWASWSGGTGCEMKFIGGNKAILMNWSQDTVTKVWSRSNSDVGTVEFLDDNWFIIRYSHTSMASLYSKGDNTYENSDGAIFRKSQINAFRVK
jgi:hypothetical protein